MEKRQSLQQGKLDIYRSKKEIRTFSNTTHTNKVKMDQNVRPDTIKLLEESISRTLS